MKSIAYTILCCALVFFTACKKDTDDNSSPRKQLLLGGKWQIIAFTGTLTHMGKDTTANLHAAEDECEKDDFILFAGDGTCTIDENVNKCPHDAQIERSKWALLDNDARLALVDSNPDTFDLELSAAEMILRQTKPNAAGEPVKYVLTLKNIK